MSFDELSSRIIAAGLKVHSDLGPGLFEEVYKACLKHVLIKNGVKVLSEVALPVHYDGCELDIGYRADLLVENTIIVELKSVESIREVHRMQLLTYLKLANKRVGLLLNFNTPHLSHGIRRIINTSPFPTFRPSRY